VKRDAIKLEVEQHLEAIGFKRGQFLWQPLQAELILMVGEAIKTIKLKSGISKRALTYELGRMAGWAEFAGITPFKPNGLAAAHVATGIPAVMAG
jgi:hypothetical protein